MKRITSMFLSVLLLAGLLAGCTITTENGEFTTDIRSAVHAVNKEIKKNGLQELPLPEEEPGRTAQLRFTIDDIEIALIGGEISQSLKKVRFANNIRSYGMSTRSSDELMMEYAMCFVKVLDSTADIDQLSDALELSNYEKSGVRKAETEHCKYSFSGGNNAIFIIEAK